MAIASVVANLLWGLVMTVLGFGAANNMGVHQKRADSIGGDALKIGD
jgi:membrane protein DedA with SNARE-associated domain